MIPLEVSKTDIAYMLGSIAITLSQEGLAAKDRSALFLLRDRLTMHLDLEDDVARDLGQLLGGRLQ